MSVPYRPVSIFFRIFQLTTASELSSSLLKLSKPTQMTELTSLSHTTVTLTTILASSVLHSSSPSPSFPVQIFTLTLAALSLLLVLLFLLPSFTTAIHYPTDFLFCLLWLIAYALLVRFVLTLGCGSIWDWGILIEGGMCGRWTSAMVAGLLGTVFWGVGAIVVSCAMMGYEGSKGG